VLEQLVWFHLTRCAGKKPLADDICVIQLTGRWRTRTSLDPRGARREQPEIPQTLDRRQHRGPRPALASRHQRNGRAVPQHQDRRAAGDQPDVSDFAGQKLGRTFFSAQSARAQTRCGVLAGLNAAKGVETALAARRLGLRPARALGSAGAIAAFPVLLGVEYLTLLAENDEASARCDSHNVVYRTRSFTWARRRVVEEALSPPTCVW